MNHENDDDDCDFDLVDEEITLYESKEKVKYSDVRQRLERFLENKRFQTELDEYYDLLSQKRPYYDDIDDLQYDR